MRKVKILVSIRGDTIVYRIKSGKSGKGKTLFECTSWDNPKATLNADLMISRFVDEHNLTVCYN